MRLSLLRARLGHAARLGLLVAGSSAATGVATASDRWEEAGSGAVAVLPVPLKAKGITGGSLVCAEQHWNFYFRTERDAVPSNWKGPAKLTIGDTQFEAEATSANGSLKMAVPGPGVDLLVSASRMGFVAGDGLANASFSLKFSSNVIKAITPRCSQVDMSAYARVALSETAPDIAAATTLLAEDAELFRNETSKEPVISATRIDVATGKALLFASICGPTSYYGSSGCALSGFASEGQGSDWRLVYETEGLLLYTDPNASSGGWPNLATLPVSGGIEPEHWAWNGSEYQIVDALINGDQASAPAELEDGVQ